MKVKEIKMEISLNINFCCNWLRTEMEAPIPHIVFRPEENILEVLNYSDMGESHIMYLDYCPQCGTKIKVIKNTIEEDKENKVNDLRGIGYQKKGEANI